MIIRILTKYTIWLPFNIADDQLRYIRGLFAS